MTQIESLRPEVEDMNWTHLRLPPFPQVGIRVLQLANKENVQLHRMSDLISSDMAFASEVLTIANSLLYAPRFPASSILQAIAVLGINNLQGMCLTVAARTYMGKALNHPAMQVIWRHNLACALIAEQLASAGFMDKDIAYTSGMLHDIGRLALATVRPKEYAALLQTHEGTGESILEPERNLFGMDHCGVGHQLISDWKLPPEFEAVVLEHHSPVKKESDWDLAELIKVSCRMADACGFPAFQGCEAATYADLLAQLPARERRLFPAEAEVLAAEIANKIQAIGSA